MRTMTAPISAFVPPALRAELELRARENRRSLSGELREALAFYLDEIAPALPGRVALLEHGTPEHPGAVEPELAGRSRGPR